MDLDGARAVIGQLGERLGRLEAENARLRGEDVQNALETSLGEVAWLREERLRLRDEVARLKGEQGKPRVLPVRGAGAAIAALGERGRPARAWHKRAKVGELPVGGTVECHLGPGELPADARLVRYLERTVQDLVLRRDNVRIRRAQYTSASTGRTYTAPAPAGYEGAFGPEVRTAMLYLHYETNASQAKIRALLTSVGVSISVGTVAEVLGDQPGLAAEYEDICRAGLASSPYQHLDATPTRLNGEEWQCHVLGGAALRAIPHRAGQGPASGAGRAAPRRAPQLRLERARTFLAAGAPLPADTREALAALPGGPALGAAAFYALLDAPLPGLGPQQRGRVADAAAIGAYRAQADVPVVETLVVDAAPQFAGLTADLALCWIHEGRHYKKLAPHLPLHRALLDAVLDAFWAYYRELQAYRQAADPREADRLRRAFDALFTCRTGYRDLDDCLRRTLARGHPLLRVLDRPHLPLQNNPAELAVRQRVRRRDVSSGARSPAGLKTWDVLQTIIATATQLGVDVWAYLHDRVSGTHALPALAGLIRERTPIAGQLAHGPPALAA